MMPEQKDFARFCRLLQHELTEQDYQLELQFYMTEKCDLACPGCYMNSSPKVAGAEIPQRHIESIIADANRYPNFSHRVCVSGGEARLIGAQKLGNVLQSMMDMGAIPELKTNASWVQNPGQSEMMFSMLSNLRVPRGRLASSQEEIDRYAASLMKSLVCLDDQVVQQEIVNRKINKKFPMVPGLGLCVSVDNKIHPAKSADWFIDLVDITTKIPELRSNYDLGVVTFEDSMRWFQQNVVFNKRVEFTEYYKHGYRFGFKCRGKDITGLQQKFHDTRLPIKPKHMHELTFQESPNAPRRLVIYYYPDETASFSLYGEKIVGRVPYVQNGQIKPLGHLMNDMFQKMIQEYVHLRTGR